MPELLSISPNDGAEEPLLALLRRANYLPLSEWDNTSGKELDKAPEWDGHTSDEVLTRLKSL